MNLKQIIKEELLKEVGEITNTYEWEGPIEPDFDSNVGYYFNTESGKSYTVFFRRFDNNEWERTFTADGSYDETGEGNAMKILSTVTQITMDFIDVYEPKVLEIAHIESRKERENTMKKMKSGTSAQEIITHKMKNPNKRANLNRLYIEKNLPKDYSYRLRGSVSIITKNEH